ncbi:MAG: DUF4139 domain-containing protein [Thermovirgaceae bacterium]|nr:DUF4139 domain-containing protein [Thermovirgaceae bacterium]
MNRFFRVIVPIVFLGVLVFGGTALEAEAVPVAGVVDVYPRGALLTMKFEAAAEMEVEMPLTLDRELIRVEGGDGVTVMNFDAKEITRPGWIPPELSDLAQEVDKARTQIDMLVSRAAALSQGIKHLGESLPAGLKGTELEAFIDTALKKRESLELKASENAVLLEKAKKQYDILKGEFDQRFPGDPDRMLLLSITTEGKGSVTVKAWTNSASWRPVYRMELNSSTGEIKGTVGAEVNQKSGVTWKGEILLHTVRPRGGINMPEMRPLVVDFLEIAPSAKAMRMEEALDMAAGPLKDLQDEPFMEEGLTDVTMKAKGTVPGFGESIRMDSGRFTEKSDVSLVCIPEFSNEAWTVATVRSSGRTFLPGEAELSVDGKDTGVTMIPARSQGQELRLPFGTTPLVTAEREEMLPTTGSSWIIKGKHQRGYVITVSNGLSRSVKVKVMDRVPVPARDTIKVQDLVLVPGPAEKDDKGFLTWEVDLEKGKSKEISVKYAITYPSDKELMFR